MRHYLIAPGKLDGPPHCHGSEEEFFLVLDGEGTCLLGDDEIPLRPGSFVGRPPGTGVAHAFRGPLTLLTYGTNEPNEICYYPRSKKSSSGASAPRSGRAAHVLLGRTGLARPKQPCQRDRPSHVAIVDGSGD